MNYILIVERYNSWAVRGADLKLKCIEFDSLTRPCNLFKVLLLLVKYVGQLGEDTLSWLDLKPARIMLHCAFLALNNYKDSCKLVNY